MFRMKPLEFEYMVLKDSVGEILNWKFCEFRKLQTWKRA